MRGGRLGEAATGRAEDYTTAFLAMAWLLGLAALTIVWGAWGYAFALGLCVIAQAAITAAAGRRAAREADWDARVGKAVARGSRADRRPAR